MILSRLFLAGLLSAHAAMVAPEYSADNLLRAHLWHDLVSRPVSNRPRVGLAFSAGSTRATAHVGVLQVLEQAGFPIDAVSGTSAGAIVGSMYCAGVPIKRLWQIGAGIKQNAGFKIGSFYLFSLLFSDSLLSSKGVDKFVRDEIGDLRFDQLAKPFACVAMDIYTGESVIFREGDVASAVRASLSLPGVFAPFEYRHRYLVDGGVVDYIPIDAVRLLGAEWILASVTETDYRSVRPKTVLDVLEQVIDIRGSFLSHEQRRLANFVIEPPVGDISLKDASRSVEAMSKGVIAANKVIRAAQENYILFSLKTMVQDWTPRQPPASRQRDR